MMFGNKLGESWCWNIGRPPHHYPNHVVLPKIYMCNLNANVVNYFACSRNEITHRTQTTMDQEVNLANNSNISNDCISLTDDLRIYN